MMRSKERLDKKPPLIPIPSMKPPAQSSEDVAEMAGASFKSEISKWLTKRQKEIMAQAQNNASRNPNWGVGV